MTKERTKEHLIKIFNEVCEEVDKRGGGLTVSDIRKLSDNGIPYYCIYKSSKDWNDFKLSFEKWLKSFNTIESDWIHVKDMLPAFSDDEVVVCREYGGERWISIANYVKIDSIEYWFEKYSNLPIYDVVCWQKLENFKIKLPEN